MSRRRRSLGPGDSGAAALEYAILLPVFLMLLLGGIDVSRALWMQVSLDRAVQAAARCASVTPTTCGSTAAIQAYAASQAWGVTVASSVFSVQAQACGVRVTAAAPFQFVTPWIAPPSGTLRSSACYPAIS